MNSKLKQLPPITITDKVVMGREPSRLLRLFKMQLEEELKNLKARGIAYDYEAAVKSYKARIEIFGKAIKKLG